MAIGTREQPEKHLDSILRPKASRRDSRKQDKVMQNRKDRKLAKLNPEVPRRRKWQGWEW